MTLEKKPSHNAGSRREPMKVMMEMDYHHAEWTVASQPGLKTRCVFVFLGKAYHTENRRFSVELWEAHDPLPSGMLAPVRVKSFLNAVKEALEKETEMPVIGLRAGNLQLLKGEI